LKIGAGTIAGAPFIFKRRSSLFAQSNSSPLAIAEDPQASVLETGGGQNTEFVSYNVDNKNSLNSPADRNKVAMQGFRTYNGNPYDDQGPGKYRLRFVEKGSEVPGDAPGFTVGPYPAYTYSNSAVNQRILPPVYESDYWINLVIPKTHGHHAGITGALKNAYGCITDPGGTHASTGTEMGRVTPYIPDIYKGVIDQTPCVLQLLDGLGGLYDWGPIHQYVCGKCHCRKYRSIDSYSLHNGDDQPGQRGKQFE